MNNTTVEKKELLKVNAWFRCSRCPVETDRGINVRVNGISMTLCRGCYQDLLEKKGTAAAGRRRE